METTLYTSNHYYQYMETTSCSNCGADITCDDNHQCPGATGSTTVKRLADTGCSDCGYTMIDGKCVMCDGS